MSLTREPIFQALFNLGSAVTWDTPARTFKIASRRVQHFSRCESQPAFFQVEHDENMEQMSGLPYKWTLNSTWMVYQNTAQDPAATPSRENNLILDALQRVVAPQFVPGEQFSDRCTLGGLVYHCHISGSVTKYDGALEGQGILVVPIKILVP